VEKEFCTDVIFETNCWFVIDRPIRNEKGVLKKARAWFNFVAGQDNNRGDDPSRPRASLVLCRPETGRWHQIRKHLSGLSHPILGDSTHGNSRENRLWREQRGMLPERTCLHLARIQIIRNVSEGAASLTTTTTDAEATTTTSIIDDIDVQCPWPPICFNCCTTIYQRYWKRQNRIWKKRREFIFVVVRPLP
jgi:hypothetical protein